MGGFLLKRTSLQESAGGERQVFERKGFSSPARFLLGEWELLLYRKILLEEDNFVQNGTHKLFCCGTLIYFGLGYRDSLNRLLSDFQHREIDQSELIGHFCVFYWNGKSLKILTDRLNTFHVFVNNERSIFSSSFLSLLAASPEPLPLNRMAVCEKLSTGYIVSPDTLVEGISQINDDLADVISHSKEGIEFLPHPSQRSIQFHNKGIGDSLDRQACSLAGHFKNLEALHTEHTGELGLSDGFDSRLLLACTRRFPKAVSLHTHSTKGIHFQSAALVQEIAKSVGLPLKVVETRTLQALENREFDEDVNDGLFYFDARCSHNMGAMSQTYTRKYKREVLGQNRLSFNGLGGEVYRNYYDVRRHSTFELRGWMDLNVYYPLAQEAIGDPDLYEAMHENKLSKISSRLNVEFKDKTDFLGIRRYYSEVRMPDCDAINSDAQNQLSFYHMPFTDPSLVCEGINATPYIGLGGDYQAALIKKLSPKLAKFTSHYGYSFNSRAPLKNRLKSKLREELPAGFLYKRLKHSLFENRNSALESANRLINERSLMRESREALLEFGVIKSLEDALLHYAQRPTTLYLGVFLREFQSKLKRD